MRRRKLLSAAVATGLAGCNLDLSSTDPTTKSPTDPTDTSTDNNSGPTATPVTEDPPTYRPNGEESELLTGDPFTQLRIDTLPGPVPFSGWVNFQSQPAGSKAGKLTIGMDNHGDESLGLEGGTPDGFSESDSGIIVHDNWSSPSVEDKDENCPRGRPDLTDERDAQWVDPGYTIEKSVDIFVDPGVQPCFPAGEHYIDSTYDVYPDHSSFVDDEPVVRFHWGFTLVVD